MRAGLSEWSVCAALSLLRVPAGGLRVEVKSADMCKGGVGRVWGVDQQVLHAAFKLFQVLKP